MVSLARWSPHPFRAGMPEEALNESDPLLSSVLTSPLNGRLLWSLSGYRQLFLKLLLLVEPGVVAVERQ